MITKFLDTVATRRDILTVLMILAILWMVFQW